MFTSGMPSNNHFSPFIRKAILDFHPLICYLFYVICHLKIVFCNSGSMFSIFQESPLVDRPSSVAAKPIVPRPKKHRLAANFNVNVSDMQ